MVIYHSLLRVVSDTSRFLLKTHLFRDSQIPSLNDLKKPEQQIYCPKMLNLVKTTLK